MSTITDARKVASERLSREDFERADSVASELGGETEIVAFLLALLRSTDLTPDDLRTAGFSPTLVTTARTLIREEAEPLESWLIRAAVNETARQVLLALNRHQMKEAIADGEGRGPVARSAERALDLLSRMSPGGGLPTCCPGGAYHAPGRPSGDVCTRCGRALLRVSLRQAVAAARADFVSGLIGLGPSGAYVSAKVSERSVALEEDPPVSQQGNLYGTELDDAPDGGELWRDVAWFVAG